MNSTVARWTAGCAGLLTVAGGGAVVLAVAGQPDPWIGGYVSEAGVAGAPRPELYRLGILGLALGLAALGLATLDRPTLDRSTLGLPTLGLPTLGLPTLGLPTLGGALLVTGGGAGVVSALVPCTAGCPLPPYQPLSFPDLVHAAASGLALACAIAAMWWLRTAGPTGTVLGRLAGAGFAVAAPLYVALALGLLAVGHTAVTSALERALLIAVFGWILATATATVTTAAGPTATSTTASDRRDCPQAPSLSTAGSPGGCRAP